MGITKLSAVKDRQRRHFGAFFAVSKLYAFLVAGLVAGCATQNFKRAATSPEPVHDNGGADQTQQTPDPQNETPNPQAQASSAQKQGQTTNQSTNKPVDTTQHPAATSTGCGTAPKATGLTPQTISVKGSKRSYLLSISSNYDPLQPHRLVFGWHGLGLSGKQMQSFVAPIEDEAKGEAIFVYPDTSVYGETRNLNPYDSGPDVSLFDALVQDLAKTYCVDPKRIFSIGFSDGAFFTNSLGQARAKTLRGIIAIAGGGGGGAPLAAMIIHSKDDDNVGFGSGLGSVQQWAKSNGCKADNVAESLLDTCQPLSGCRPGYPVIFCRWGKDKPDQGTHDWPRFPSANGDIWQFIKQF